jgi:hypothetical protein
VERTSQSKTTKNEFIYFVLMIAPSLLALTVSIDCKLGFRIPRIIVDAKKADWCLKLSESSALGARFGSEITTVDLNGDGKRDIVISAPRYTDPNGNEMVGIVFVVMSPFPPTL